MFSIKRNKQNKIVEIEFTFVLFEFNETNFKMSRNFSEQIGKTMDKLAFNITKKYEALKKDKDSAEKKVIIADLYDEKNQLIPNETLNEHAWKEGYQVKINENVFPVVVDLPILKKLSLPKQLISQMPVIVITDKEDIFIDKCKFKWYISSKEFDTNDWELVNEGVNNRMIYLNENAENKYVKIVCTPNDGIRDGLPIEVISNKTVEKHFDINELPMTDRHKLTTEKMRDNKY